MRTWLDLDGRKVPVEVTVAAPGGAVTAKASPELVAIAPTLPTAIAALSQLLAAGRAR